MNVQLTPRSEKILQGKAASGHDPSAVIEEALLLLEDQEHLANLRAAVAVGQAQHDRGERIPYTSDSMAVIKQNAQRKLREGRTPKADVCP
jgi:hypothetical protein